MLFLKKVNMLKPPIKKTIYGRDHKRKLVLLNEGLYTIHSPYLSAIKEYISSSVFPSLIKSLTTSLIVWQNLN